MLRRREYRALIQFLSTPSARRATSSQSACCTNTSISIHALREEGDTVTVTAPATAPAFLSTPSARRATLSQRHAVNLAGISIHALREEGDSPAAFAFSLYLHFYPRPPRGGRRSILRGTGPATGISIHALREEGDVIADQQAYSIKRFLSTPSARRATFCPRRDEAGQKDFYPRPPRGGRQQKQRQNLYFQTNYTTFCTNLEEP